MFGATGILNAANPRLSGGQTPPFRKAVHPVGRHYAWRKTGPERDGRQPYLATTMSIPSCQRVAIVSSGSRGSVRRRAMALASWN
jgi:hypothetical protein